MKKFTAILLALVLVLAMSASAFAASITITPPTVTSGASQGDITYTAYKIFDATISNSNVSYTIDSASPYYETVKAATDYFDLTQVGSSTTYVVTVKEDYDATAAKSFADTLKGVSSATAAGTLEKQDDGTYKLDDLDSGYYLVTSSLGTALILDTIGDVNVNSKNSYPDLSKTVDVGKNKTTADMGEVLTFTIKVEIPATADGGIVVHDKMTGLEYQSMTEVNGVTAGSNGLTDDCAVHFTLSADYVKENLGKTVTITYTAKVTADTAKNEAYLVDAEYSSVPKTNDIYSTDIVIDKVVSGTDGATKLAGAKFVLQNEEDKYYFYNVTTKAVEWKNDLDDATEVTTDSDGSATFADLADGTYYLIETEAPAGYNKLVEKTKVELTAETTDIEGNTVRRMSLTATVENATGSKLPSTGGMGTTIFYVVGGLMVTLAVVVLVAKKKVGADK